MGDSDSGYRFGSGIGDDELARLEAQGAATAPATRMIFAEAGIRPGMRVLDLGCGAGDVSFVAAALVGPGGSVVGLDRSPEALARARLRAEQRGLTQVRFVAGDLADPAPGGPFDAIVERLVLMWVPDPAALLRQQATVLRPGGLVVPIEMDLSTLGWRPETPFAAQVKSWLVEAFAKAGIATLGPRLWSIVQEAGLRPRGMIGVQPHFGPGDPVGVATAVENLRLAVPLIVSTGVATAEQIGIETFEQRLRDEQQRSQAVAATPILLSAWATCSPGQLPGRRRRGTRGQVRIVKPLLVRNNLNSFLPNGPWRQYPDLAGRPGCHRRRAIRLFRYPMQRLTIYRIPI